MSILSNIFSKGAKELVDSASGLIDNLSTSDEEKGTLKNQLSALVFKTLSDLQAMQRDVLLAELGGNWLQRSWRPIVMLTFAALIVVGAFYTIPYLNDNSPFWELIKLGMGGYIVGRSVEKVADNVTKNIDLTSLRKKDRKDNIETR